MAVTEEVGRRSRVRAFRFPRARAKGSCCLRLPLGVWIELRGMPEGTAPIEKSNENQLYLKHFGFGSFINQMIFNCLGSGWVGHARPGQVGRASWAQSRPGQAGPARGALEFLCSGSKSASEGFLLCGSSAGVVDRDANDAGPGQAP